MAHLKAHAVRTDGPFTLRSGAVSNWYIDARQTTFDGAGSRLVGEAVLEQVADDIDCVGGMTMGADPISLATALVAADRGRPLRSFSIRKEAKDHGTGGRLVGPVGAGDTVVVLEDTTTTGSALAEAIDALLESGVKVALALALVDRSSGAAEAKVAPYNIPFLALVTPVDLGVEN